jgi:hypothetical protein
MLGERIMKYLAISKTPYYVAYAVFLDKHLIDYGKNYFTQDTPSKRLVELYNVIDNLIQEFRPQFILTHLIDKERTMKKDLERIVEVRTILRLVCENENILYNEFKTSGWEKRITDNKPTVARKLRLINDGYELDIDDIEVANAIILGEGVAWNRLHIGE